MICMGTYVLLVLALGGCVSSSLVADNSRLVHDLFSESVTLTPPYDVNGTVAVQYGVSLQAVVDAGAKPYTHLTHTHLQFWDNLAWRDARLSWDPKEYSDIESINVPTRMLWKPDIMAYNSYGSEELKTMAEVLAVVTHTGDVLWVRPNIKQIQCARNITVLSCSMKFGSWTYNRRQIDLNFFGKAAVDTSSFSPSGGISAIPEDSNYAVRNILKYDCCPDTYVDLTFYFDLEINRLSGAII